MLSESEKRAAALAVSRYGADRAQVQEVIQAVLEARAGGRALDLLDLFLQQDLLTSVQAQELRALDITRIDTAGEANGNGTANGRAKRAPEADPRAADDADGEPRVLGDYRLLRRLGTGGMGAVYLGYQEGVDRHVAIKVLPVHLAMNQGLVDRFYREAKSGALLNHPNIVRNLTVGQDSATGRHYLVLEYVDGPSAQALLDEMGRLPVGDAVRVVLDIARALEHAHSRSIVHRDIKPANILTTQSGLAKLADLGLAKRTDETSHLTAARQGFGTPYYMPYEQAMNARSADARSDIYALGATFYHLLTGEVPFPGTSHLEIVDKKNLGFYEPASVVNPEVPAVLDEILAKMLAREPRDRYQTASELIVDLDRSGLGTEVPSFVDQERALQDPLMRQRLTTPAELTCPDLALQKTANPPAADLTPPWYIRYRDRHRRLCKAKATGEQIRQRLREGRMPRDAEVSPKPQGDFVRLAEIAEFQEALEEGNKLRALAKKRPFAGMPSASATRHGTNEWLMIGLAATLGLLLVAIMLFLILSSS
jgi:serine/threonine protein kinase